MARPDDKYILTGKDGWQCTFNLTTGVGTSNVGISASFAHSEVYTVQFHVVPPLDSDGDGKSYGIFAATATIRWLVEGNYVIRQCSVANGTSISGVGQGVTVSIQDITTVLDPGPPPVTTLGHPYSVSAQVSRGVRPNTQQPVTMDGISIEQEAAGKRGTIVLNPSDTNTYLIPPDAGVISNQVIGIDQVTNENPAKLVVIQCALYSDVSNTTSKIFSGNGGFIPIAQNAQAVVLLNAGPNPVECSLTWGIDG